MMAHAEIGVGRSKRILNRCFLSRFADLKAKFETLHGDLAEFALWPEGSNISNILITNSLDLKLHSR